MSEGVLDIGLDFSRSWFDMPQDFGASWFRPALRFEGISPDLGAITELKIEFSNYNQPHEARPRTSPE
jgi:hypothetical protein